MLDDARYALRSLRRKPLPAMVAVLTLGLGIGGASAVFSVVDAVVLRSLPFEDPDRLVRVWELTRDGDRFSVSDPAYLELAAASRTLRPVAAYKEQDVSVVLADGGEPQRINALQVSASLAEVLGVPPQLGRMFTDDEDRPGVAERRVVLSDGLWRSRFNGASDIIGRLVTINGNPFTVTGVMPPGFDFPGNADAWIQLAADVNADPGDKALAVIARLAPGATLEQAAGELREVTRRWSQAYPEANGGWSAEAVPFSEWIISPRFRDAVWVLFGAVTLLLLLACANVANLLVAQAMSRQGEMHVRTALGAARGRLVRQLFTESAVLAVLGTAAGVLIAVWSVDAVHALGGGGLPRLASLRVDGAVLLFACAAGVISCLTFGLAPAVYATRVDLRSAIDEGVRYTARSTGLRHTLVVVEVALALLLLVGAGLLGNSFVRLMNVDPGFDVETTLAMPIEHRSPRYPDDRVADFYRDLLERVRAIPGVTAAGATATNPFRQFGFSNSVTPEERAAQAPPSGLVQAGWRSVTPGFFDAMRIPVLAGRTFADSDRNGAERVVVVSESLGRRLWPGESPIGKRIYWGGTSGRTRTVIGVSGDIRDVQLDAEPTPILFVPHAQVDVPLLTIVIRTPEPVEQIAPAIRQILRDLDAGLPAPPIYRLAGSRAEATMAPRFNLSLLAAFATIALVLAVTGVYAMLAFMVSERRREIAVRLALGASGPQIARLVLRTGLRLSLLGVILGIGGAVAATELLSRLLYGVEPTDPLTFTAAAVALLAAAAVASYVPARQASRLDAAAVLNRGV
jgi:putative ABC transport system permease protein